MKTTHLFLAASSLLIAVAAVLLIPSSARAAGDWPWPVTGQVLTPYRNADDPYAGGQHRGIDIAGEEGQAVVSATPGTVTFAGVAGSSGLTVGVRTADGRHEVSYLHLASTAVRAGEPVVPGRAIGTVGLSGRRSAEAPHLHFGVREAGTEHAYLDPLAFLTETPVVAPPPPEVPAPDAAASAPGPAVAVPAPAAADGPGARPRPRAGASAPGRVARPPAPAPTPAVPVTRRAPTPRAMARSRSVVPAPGRAGRPARPRTEGVGSPRARGVSSVRQVATRLGSGPGARRARRQGAERPSGAVAASPAPVAQIPPPVLPPAAPGVPVGGLGPWVTAAALLLLVLLAGASRLRWRSGRAEPRPEAAGQAGSAEAGGTRLPRPREPGPHSAEAHAGRGPAGSGHDARRGSSPALGEPGCGRRRRSVPDRPGGPSTRLRSGDRARTPGG